MGAGASSLPRLRKALLMKAYNSRKQADLTLFEQFLPFAYQKEDSAYYINLAQIKACLGLEGNKDYAFLDDLLYAMFHKSPYSQHTTETDTAATGSSSPEVNDGSERDIYFYDFIQFLETGKVPTYNSAEDMRNSNTNTRNLPGPDLKKKPPPHPSSTSASTANTAAAAASTPSTSSRHATPPKVSTASGSSKTSTPRRPPQPPRSNDAAGENNSQDDESNIESKPSNQEEEEEVIQINLARIPSSSSSFKINSSASPADADSKSVSSSSAYDPDTLEIIVRPSKQGLGGQQMTAPGKQLWRKREVVRQEKTVHYTTVDENGELQELVEKETTQTEVLHMECRETGEFAHRELTQYEQVETFNEEIVNAVRGNEEYVHLKSLEDEFHYMDSNMPQKERDDRELEEEEARRAMEAEGADGERRPRYYYDPNEVPPDYDPNDPNDPRNDPNYQPYREGDEDGSPHRRYKMDPNDMDPEPVGAKDRSYLFEQESPDPRIDSSFLQPDEVPPPLSSFKAHYQQHSNPNTISPLSDLYEQYRDSPEAEFIRQQQQQLEQDAIREDPLMKTMHLSELQSNPKAAEPVVMMPKVAVVEEEATISTGDEGNLHRATSYESMHDID